MTPKRNAWGTGRATARTIPRLGALGTILILTVSAAAGLSFGAASGGTFALGPAHASAPGSASVQGALTPSGAHAATATLVNVTFRELHLPNGSVWSVSAGSPPVGKNNTTSATSGAIVFAEPNGTLNYSISGPSGFGVAKIEGKGIPSQSSDTINGTTTLTVWFAPIVTLTFNETGLAPGTVWGISLHTALPHGGPAAPANQTTNGTSLSFQVVKGTWKFVVAPVPVSYKAMPAKGAVGTGHVGAKVVHFRAIMGNVVFRERGLATGTLWQVNLTGPMSGSLNGTGSTLKFHLIAGTYTFTIWNFSAVHPQPETGTFVISGPGSPVVEAIVYS